MKSQYWPTLIYDSYSLYSILTLYILDFYHLENLICISASNAPSFNIKDVNQTFINVTWNLKMDPKSGTVIYIEYRKEGKHK